MQEKVMYGFSKKVTDFKNGRIPKKVFTFYAELFEMRSLAS